jgi:hypothetical protein
LGIAATSQDLCWVVVGGLPTGQGLDNRDIAVLDGHRGRFLEAGYVLWLLPGAGRVRQAQLVDPMSGNLLPLACERRPTHRCPCHRTVEHAQLRPAGGHASAAAGGWACFSCGRRVGMLQLRPAGGHASAAAGGWACLRCGRRVGMPPLRPAGGQALETAGGLHFRRDHHGRPDTFRRLSRIGAGLAAPFSLLPIL